MQPINIFWFRRDLRLDDNTGLFHALCSDCPVMLLFIFDTDILSKLENKQDARVEFIHNALSDLNRELDNYNCSILVKHGKPTDVWKKLINEFNIKTVYVNHDYEPYAIKRDDEISKYLSSNGIRFKTYKDQVIFEKDEILNKTGAPYMVFTPYSKAWLKSLNPDYYKSSGSEKILKNLYHQGKLKIPSLIEIGFKETGMKFPPKRIKKDIVKNYHKNRDYPFINGTSRLSVHLRFGTLSIRRLVTEALKLNAVWLNELIWREFFMSILFHFPHVVNQSFRKEYDRIKWRNNYTEFEAWRTGNTGYPLVDAGMRELNQTGYMHNRVRMITASFLTKHLLIDWRGGEQYFADKLLDYELSSNNGNWQWAAGTGCDASPYFRVFNPVLQATKFDPQMKYVKKWVPEFNTTSYPKPIVEHKFARDRAINTYKTALKK